MPSGPATLADMLAEHPNAATALTSPGGAPLSYQALRTLLHETLTALAARGIGRSDRVAMVLENGPEMAAAFLSVAAGAAAAPLNPAYRADEFEFFLTDLKAKLLIVGGELKSPSVQVAARLGIPVARLRARPER
ncbi:MAG TPA: AMP-binding protein, partial [Gemmatimonadales bacterium]|nr:AMP-binding protein [Gemmatimonadales bacterium]